MFDENVSGAPGINAAESLINSAKAVSLSKPVKLSEEEAIEYLSNWNLVVAYTLLDQPGFIFNSTTVSQRLNILKSDAENIIQTLDNMGLLQKTDKIDQFSPVKMHFDDSFLLSGDLLSLFSKFSQISLSKLSSRDIFNGGYELMSRKVIQRYQPEFLNLMSKIAEDSKGEIDCEVYATTFSFSKATRTKKGE